MLRKLSIAFLLTVWAFAQAPQSNTVQSKSTAFLPYLQPPAPALAGLWVNVNVGSFWLSGTPVTLCAVACRLPVAANNTTYIFADLTLATVTSNMAGFSGTVYPIAVVVTDAKKVVTLNDVRPDVFGGGGGGGGGIGTITGITTVAGSGLSGGTLTGIAGLSLLTGCNAGQGPEFDGVNWGCFSLGTLLGVTAGNGVAVTGSATNPTVGIITCADGQVIRSALGVWGCSTVSVTPGSPTTSVQFNVGGAFTGDSTFFFTVGTHTLNIQNLSLTGTLAMSSPWLNQSTFPGSITCPNGFIAGQNCWGILLSGHLGEFFNGSSTGLEYARIGTALSSPTNPVCADGSGNLTQTGCTGTTGIVVNPSTSQNIVQPAGTQTSTNNLGGIRFINADGSPYAWTSNGTGALTAATPATITITCPKYGVFAATDTTSFFKIAGTGTTEYVNLTGGTCAPGTTSGTVSFTPVFSHSAGWTIGSPSTGLNEAIIDAATNGAATCTPWPTCLKSWRVITAPTAAPTTTFFTISARLTVPPASNGELDGKGAQVDCEALESCIYLPANSANVSVHGFRVGTKLSTSAAKITNTDCGISLSNTATITSTLNPGIGNWVDIQNTDATKYWGPHQVTASTSTNFQYADSTCNGGGVVASAATPGGAAYPRIFIRDNGNGNNIFDIVLDTPGGYVTNGLHNLIVVENDQAFNATAINANGTGVRCDTNYCGQIIYNPPNFNTNPAVIHVRDSQLSMQCGGNGISAYGGNTISVSNSVIQGFSQFGVKSFGVGGFGPATAPGLYEEVGGCNNPTYTDAGLASGAPARSQAGFVASRSLDTNATIGSSGSPIGQEPIFCTAGGTVEEYWVVIHDGGTTAALTTLPLRFGQGNTSCGSILIGWPRYSSPTVSTVTYDILKTQGAGNALTAPLGDGVNHAVALATAVAQCSGLVCTMTDTHPALSNYAALADPQLYPALAFWPGSVVLPSGALLYTNDLPITNLSSVIVTEQNIPQVFSHRCGATTAGIYISCLAGNSLENNNGAIGAQLIQNGIRGGGQTANLVGRTIYMQSPAGSVNSGEIITLVPASPSAILADGNHRPVQNANDTYVGLDNGSANIAFAQLTFGAPIAISNYIGSVPDGSSWKNRQTATLFTVVTPFSNTGATTTIKRLSCANASSLIAGDFTLGSGWGTGSPTLTFPVTKATDCAGVINIATTSSGTTPNPTIQLTFHDGTWTTVPICTMEQSGPSTADIASYLLVNARSATSYTWFWGATPTVSKSYEFTFHCQGS